MARIEWANVVPLQFFLVGEAKDSFVVWVITNGNQKREGAKSESGSGQLEEQTRCLTLSGTTWGTKRKFVFEKKLPQQQQPVFSSTLLILLVR